MRIREEASYNKATGKMRMLLRMLTLIQTLTLYPTNPGSCFYFRTMQVMLATIVSIK